MNMTEQSTSSSGTQAQRNEKFYRFPVLPSEDLNLEVVLPEDDTECITPIVAHTDDLFKSALFTYDTDLFVHRVGLCKSPNDRKYSKEEILNYITYYDDAFVSTVREYINFHAEDFGVSEIEVPELREVFPDFNVESYGCIFHTQYDVDVTLPVRTTILKVNSYEIAIRTIPNMMASMWQMYPTLFPDKLYRENDTVRNTVNDWLAECEAYEEILREELLTLCTMISIQHGVKRPYPATVFEYESPLYTVLADHTASHAIQVVLAGGIVAYIVHGEPHCYSITGDFLQHSVRIVRNPATVLVDNEIIVLGNDKHLCVTINSNKIIELTTELESADVFRKKLLNTLFP